MRKNTLSLGLFISFLLMFSSASYSDEYGMDCEKPTISTSGDVIHAFSFECTNTTDVTFGSYQIFPISGPDVTVTATACSGTIAPGAKCLVQGTFSASKPGVSEIDFDDKYGGERHYGIFCNNPEKGCIEAGVTGVSFAYVVNVRSSTINLCPVVSMGLFGTCENSGATGLNEPQRVVLFEPTNQQLYGYVTDYLANTVIQYPVNNSGIFSAPVNTTSGFDDPTGLVFQMVGSKIYVYVLNSNGNSVSQCPVDAHTGKLGTCVDSEATGVSFHLPENIVFEMIGTKLYAYVTNYANSSINKCPVDSESGKFGECADSKATGFLFSTPIGLAFENIGNKLYAYVTNDASSSISQCPVDDAGNFGKCINSGATSLSGPWAVAFETIGTKLFAYVVNNSANSVSQCPVDTHTGNLGACIEASNGPFNHPVGITFL